MAKKRRAGTKGKRAKGAEAEPAANSQRQLADVHRVSLGAVQKWLRDPRWKEAGLRPLPPWSPAEIARQRDWRRDNLQEDRAADPGGASAELGAVGIGTEKLGRARAVAQIRKLVAQEEQIRLDIAIKREEYIKRADAEENQALKVRAIKSSLEQLGKSLRQPLADAEGDAARCQAILDEALRALCMEAFG